MKDFLQKFRLLLKGELPDHSQYLRLLNEVLVLRQENAMLQQVVKDKAVRSTLDIPVEGFDDLSDEPTDGDDRIRYIAQVDEFYEGILRKKIRTAVAGVRGLLANLGYDGGVSALMPRNEYDAFVRGMEAGLLKIHDWATTCQGELRDKQK